MNPPLSVHSFPFRRWLPLLVGLVLLVATLAIVVQDLWLNTQRLSQNQIRTLQLINTQIALPLRRSLEIGDIDTLRALLSSAVLDDDIDWVVLTDPQRNIIDSSHYAWEGRPLDQVLPSLRNLITAQSQDSLHIASEGDLLISIKPISYLPVLDQGPRKSTLLWIGLDTRPKRQLLHTEALHHTAVLTGTVAFLAILLLWGISRYITRPLMILETAAHRLADGKLDTRLEVRGKGDIAELAGSIQNMAEQIHHTVQALTESKQRLAVTLNSIGDAVLVTDQQGLVTSMNPTAEKLTGWSAQEATGHPVIEVLRIIDAGTRKPAEHPIGRVLREGAVVGMAPRTTLIARDGTEYQITDSAAPIRDEKGQILGAIMVFQDISQRYAMEAEVLSIKERLHAILSSLPDPCFLLDAEGRYLDVLGGPEELPAQNREILLQKQVQDVLPPEQAKSVLHTIRETIRTGMPQRLEYGIDMLSGHRLFEGTTASVMDKGKNLVIWLARDITTRKEAERQLQEMARYDQLTGLANRTMTSQNLEQLLRTNRRNGHFGAVMFIDIDRFKTINDSLGHQLGDQLLCHVAGILRREVRAEDLASRFGGDEFVVVLGDLGTERMSASTHAELIAQKLRKACMQPVVLDEQSLQVTISIGIVLFPDDGGGVEELLKRADIAMYKAKDAGRNRICFFSRELQEIAESHLTIQRELRTALEEDQLTLYVQPRVNQAGFWIGGEVLVRWQHPERGLLLPGSFIPIAEASGLIDDIDQWVISHTISGLAEVQKTLPKQVSRISMNITAGLLLDPQFPDELGYWCMENAVSPDQLELEITERVLLDEQAHATEIIESLRGMGIHFSIDDFGTGYSSLRYLQRLPLDTLKIDKSFVERLPTHASDARIVTTIIDMAEHLSLGIIAEGVETEAQAEFLREQGCEQFQGYLYARPMPWEDFFRTLPENQPPDALS